MYKIWCSRYRGEGKINSCFGEEKLIFFYISTSKLRKKFENFKNKKVKKITLKSSYLPQNCGYSSLFGWAYFLALIFLGLGEEKLNLYIFFKVIAKIVLKYNKFQILIQQKYPEKEDIFTNNVIILPCLAKKHYSTEVPHMWLSSKNMGLTWCRWEKEISWNTNCRCSLGARML